VPDTGGKLTLGWLIGDGLMSVGGQKPRLSILSILLKHPSAKALVGN